MSITQVPAQVPALVSSLPPAGRIMRPGDPGWDAARPVSYTHLTLPTTPYV